MSLESDISVGGQWDTHDCRSRLCSQQNTGGKVLLHTCCIMIREFVHTTSRRSRVIFASNTGTSVFGPQRRFWLSFEKKPQDSSLDYGL